MLPNLNLKELAYVLGLFCGDGYANYNPKDRHYRCEWILNVERDVAIIKKLTQLLHKSGFRPFYVKDKRSKAMSIRVNSKSLFETMKTEEDEWIANLGNNEFALGFLSGLIDSDGWVCNGEIAISQKERLLLENCKEAAQRLGLRCRLWKCANPKSANGIWRLRISTKFKYLPHSSVKVQNAYPQAFKL